MTSAKKLALCIGVIISFLCVGVYAQSAGTKANHFAAEGISFDYPSEYSVKDESTPEEQQFIITRQGSSVQLTIVVPLRLVMRSTYPVAVENFIQPMLKKVAMTLGEGTNSPERTSFQTSVGTKQAEGVRLRLTDSGKTAEVIWLRWSLRLVELVFVRSDADESVGAKLWQTVSSSLRVEAPVVSVMATGAQPTQGAKIGADVINRKALSLPAPSYPAAARDGRVSGTVRVQVVVDEQGRVIAAHAVDGPHVFHSSCVAAARQARFSPTLLEGEPIRITGVIQYNFVAH